MTQIDSRAGVAYAASAYIIWGIIPFYWRLLAHVGALELTVHRVLWCAVAVAGMVFLRGRWPAVRGVFADRRLLATLALTSVLISINWGLYIWCVVSEQIVEASLGYYINPLVSITLGVVLLGERMSLQRKIAVGLAAVAVGVQTAAFGHFPAIALTLAFSFGLYGYYRKIANIGALEGLLVETALLFPLTIGLVLYWGWQGTGHFLVGAGWTDLLLIGAGPLTAIPLALFAAGARRIRLSTLGFLQYLAPSLMLILATVFFGEAFTWIHAASFGCVWFALILIAVEGRAARLTWTRRFPPAG